MYLTREQILAAQDRKYVEVDVPEWGGKVRLQSLSADETLYHEALSKRRQQGDLKVNPLTSMLAASIVDEHGNLLFTEKDLAALGKKSPSALIRLINAVKELNKVEVPEGNLEANLEEG